MMRYSLLLPLVLIAGPVAAQIPADVSMGFAFGNGCCTVAGEVTEHLSDRLAVVGGAYWSVDSSVSQRPVTTAGFYGGPRLYTERPSRLRPFGEFVVGFAHSRPPAHAITFTPALGVEFSVAQDTRFRTSVGYGLAFGFGKEGRGLNVTTALVLIPAREER